MGRPAGASGLARPPARRPPRPWARAWSAAAVLAAAAACATPHGRIAAPAPTPGATETGEASWYGRAHQGRRTASGERYDMNALTAAHPSLPFGTRVLVTNMKNGRSVEVRINDRGPTVRGRIIDLSYAAARALGAVGDGTVPVTIRVLPPPPARVATPPGDP